MYAFAYILRAKLKKYLQITSREYIDPNRIPDKIL